MSIDITFFTNPGHDICEKNVAKTIAIIPIKRTEYDTFGNYGSIQRADYNELFKFANELKQNDDRRELFKRVLFILEYTREPVYYEIF